MASLKEEIYDILYQDAQSVVAGSLGDLLENPTTEPYKVYQNYPLDQPRPPFIIFQLQGRAKWPINMILTLSVIGYNYELIHDRIRDLLIPDNSPRERGRLIENADDIKHLGTFFESFGPDNWDMSLKQYFRTDTYVIKGILK